MEIRKPQGIQGSDIVRPEPAAIPPKKGGETGQVQGDSVTLSGGAQESARLAAAANALPDIRNDKVQAIRSALESGTYRVEGSKVAEKLLREVIIDTTV